MNRRQFLLGTSAVVAAAALPMPLPAEEIEFIPVRPEAYAALRAALFDGYIGTYRGIVIREAKERFPQRSSAVIDIGPFRA